MLINCKCKEMRICVFCQTWESGGIESFVYSVLSNMDMSRFKVDIVVEELRESIFTEPLKRIGIVFIELSGSTRNLYKNYQKFARLIEQRKYDVMHLNVFQAQAMMYLALARHKEIPVRIVHSHNNMLRVSKMRPFKMLIHKISRNLFSMFATDWWACSESSARFMFTPYVIRNKLWQFIPDGIDLEKFQLDEKKREQVRKELCLEDCFVIGNVGRFCHQKNQKFLLETFSVLHSEAQNSKLLLVGAGEDEQQLRDLAEILGISKDVIFYGVSEHVEHLLWAMDVFAFPSRFEGFGIAIIEAQAAGLPVICSDNVPPEVVISEQVKRIPLKDEEIWIFEMLNAKREKQEGILHPGLQRYGIQKVSDMLKNKYLQGRSQVCL